MTVLSHAGHHFHAGVLEPLGEKGQRGQKDKKKNKEKQKSQRVALHFGVSSSTVLNVSKRKKMTLIHYSTTHWCVTQTHANDRICSLLLRIRLENSNLENPGSYVGRNRAPPPLPLSPSWSWSRP